MATHPVPLSNCPHTHARCRKSSIYCAGVRHSQIHDLEKSTGPYGKQTPSAKVRLSNKNPSRSSEWQAREPLAISYIAPKRELRLKFYLMKRPRIHAVCETPEPAEHLRTTLLSESCSLASAPLRSVRMRGVNIVAYYYIL